MVEFYKTKEEKRFNLEHLKNKYMYWIKRKIWQIKNVIKWLPMIWNQYDFDYSYSLKAFKFQLEKQAYFLESEKAITVDSKHNASRIRMILRLMDKVYDHDYSVEYQEEFGKIYGEGLLNIKFIATDSPELCEIKSVYELIEDKDKVREMKQVERNLFLNSIEKQNRAHKLLWQLVEHNIQSW